MYHSAAQLHLQVLIATKLQRTPSLACPDLFTFADHFAFESILGRSSHTEVGAVFCQPCLVSNKPEMQKRQLCICCVRYFKCDTSAQAISLPLKNLQGGLLPRRIGKGGVLCRQGVT